MIFDMTIPGWLPPSSSAKHGHSQASNAYSIFATATYRSQNDSAWLWCLPAWTKQTTRSAEPVAIDVLRHRVTPPVTDAGIAVPFPPSTFAVTARARETSPIPNHVISNMQILVSVPEFISSDTTHLPVTLKSKCTAAGLCANQVDVNVDQLETFHRTPDNDMVARFPIPSAQPPSVPLLHQHPLDTFGVAFEDTESTVVTRSLLDPELPSRFRLEEDTGSGKVHELSRDWSQVELKVSLSNSRTLQKIDSPFIRVRHILRMSMHVSYQGGEDTVQFSLPLQFVVLPPVQRVDPTPARPYSQYEYAPSILPAYVQLFHDNGEAKIDPVRGIPPAYSDRELPSERKVEAPEFIPIGTRSLDLPRLEQASC